MKFFSRSPLGHAPDYVIVVGTFLLIMFGLIMLTSASSDIGKAKFGDSYFYLKHQLWYGFSAGIIGFLFAANFCFCFEFG